MCRKTSKRQPKHYYFQALLKTKTIFSKTNAQNPNATMSESIPVNTSLETGLESSSYNEYFSKMCLKTMQTFSFHKQLFY